MCVVVIDCVGDNCIVDVADDDADECDGDADCFADAVVLCVDYVC